jgi:hypothetical protein
LLWRGIFIFWTQENVFEIHLKTKGKFERPFSTDITRKQFKEVETGN